MAEEREKEIMEQEQQDREEALRGVSQRDAFNQHPFFLLKRTCLFLMFVNSNAYHSGAVTSDALRVLLFNRRHPPSSYEPAPGGFRSVYGTSVMNEAVQMPSYSGQHAGFECRFKIHPFHN